VAVTDNGAMVPPVHKVWALDDGWPVMAGSAFTVMVKLFDSVPRHVPAAAYTVMVAVWAVAPLFWAVKDAIFPVP